MAHQQHAELVDAADDFILHQALGCLRLPVLAGEFMDREHGVVARMIGVMHGRPVGHARHSRGG